MKQLLIAAMLLIGISFSASAQTVTVTASNATSFGGAFNTLDTLTNAETNTFVLTGLTSARSVVTFQVNFTKISGTVAGTIKYYMSIGGGHYKLIQTDNLTDASGVFAYSFIPSTGSAYKIEVATTGTSSSSYTARYLYRSF